ncbi:hypothetical protein MY4824_006139 [Beauveria thailandica]
MQIIRACESAQYTPQTPCYIEASLLRFLASCHNRTASKRAEFLDPIYKPGHGKDPVNHPSGTPTAD